ncbi:MAG TPA: RNA methyltransferase [Phycisphaerae bacterium]|nr:RNA methyltransferase [Phycisphaerae bacterium]
MSRVSIVLVRPQIAGNIGAVARLAENFAAGDLYIVSPETDPLSQEALQRSTHGEHRLRAARVVPTLADALQGVAYAIGTSCRAGPVHQEKDLLPRDLGPLLVENTARGDVALLFGSEDCGLSREELLSCDALLQIPASPGYPTLNISHAVAICLYEAFLALKDFDQTSANVRRQDEPADLAIMSRLIDKLTGALGTIGYLHSDKPDHLMFPIRAILSRARLSRTEARILMGLAQQIEDFARTGKPHR